MSTLQLTTCRQARPKASGAPHLGRSYATLGVSQAVQDTARLQQAAKLAAAVALPPAPATPAPGMAGNVGRASVADLFTATPPVFPATITGNDSIHALYATCAILLAYLHNTVWL